MPGSERVSTSYGPTNEVLPFFKFLQKKVSQIGKKNPLQKSCRKTSRYTEISFVNLENFFLQKFGPWSIQQAGLTSRIYLNQLLQKGFQFSS